MSHRGSCPVLSNFFHLLLLSEVIFTVVRMVVYIYNTVVRTVEAVVRTSSLDTAGQISAHNTYLFALYTTLQRENALFILNTSANILYASNRYTPNQDTYIEDILNERSLLLIVCTSIIKHWYRS